MIVCICKVATDTDITQAIGAGAHSVEQVGRRCGAGTGCGACRNYIQDLLEQERASCPGHGCMDCSASASSREAA